MVSPILKRRLPLGGFATGTVVGLTLACAAGEVDDASSGGDMLDTGDTVAGDGDGDETPGDGDGTGDGDGDGDEACTSIGCDCDGTPDSCDEPLSCIAGICGSADCGNGIVEPGEQCDDGNDVEGDGCNNDCTWTEVEVVAAGASHTCALIEGGRVRCWGLASSGQLGYSNTNNIGDNEHPASAGDVMLGELVAAIDVGAAHNCALLVDGTVRCWGANGSGQLGLGNNNNVGDDELPIAVNTVTVANAVEIVAGASHTCARVGTGGVRCWGLASSGQLGYGNTTNLPIPLGADISLAGMASMVRVGADHSCALLVDDNVRCWGLNNYGQLGYGHTNNIGDDELPSSIVAVPIQPQGLAPDTSVTQIALGFRHSCVLFDTGEVLCWGDNFYGQIGQGHTSVIGDNETLATLSTIELGAKATALTLGRHHTCALLEGGDVKCWGRNLYGQLGYGHIDHIGDDEVPADVGVVELGGPATSITAGDYHTCAVVDHHQVLCWGFNDYGQLGYGDTKLRGNDELPVEAGPISLLADPLP
jgi:cysteine-rich repeat protein